MKTQSDQIIENYSFTKLARALSIKADGIIAGFSDDGLEKNLNGMIMKRFPSQRSNSVYIPNIVFERAMTLASGLESLNQFASKFFWPGLEIKFPLSLYKRIGVIEVDVPQGVYTIPKNTTGPQAEWLPDAGGSQSESDFNLSDFEKLKPLQLSVRLRYSRTSDIFLGEVGIAALLTAAYMALEAKLDASLFYGSGSEGEPAGLSNDDDIQVVPAGEFDLQTAASMIKLCEIANGSYDNIAFASSPSIRETLSQREKIANTGKFVLSDDKILNRPFNSSNNISGEDLWAGDFTTVILMKWFGGIELMLDTYSEQAYINLYARQYCNFVARNPSLIIRGTDFS